jgi:hypothetical protein
MNSQELNEIIASAREKEPKRPEFDSRSINYRRVVNDAACWPWEPMPEVQPPTLTALVDYLKTCRWDHTAIQQDAWRGDGWAVRFGMRQQFYIPGEPSVEDLALLAKLDEEPASLPCPCCNRPMTFSSVMTAGDHEDNHTLVCTHCDIQISRYRGIAMSKHSIAEAFKYAASHRPTAQGAAALPAAPTTKEKP